MNAYRTIVADPPWRPADGRRSDYSRCKARPQKHYATSEVDEIAAMFVPPADHLWLWTLTQHVDWGYTVARAWGFEPVTMLTWCKPGLGVGRFRCNTEHVLLCRSGRVPFGPITGTWFEWPRGRHSEKPAAFYDLVEDVSPAPRLEMFARRQRLGWDVWGNEVESDVELSVA